MQDNNMELYAAEFLLFGLPLIGGAINIILTLAQIQSDKKWYEECPGRDRCGFDKCMRHSLYGCPVSPNGEFLTAEERKELKKKIEELDD